MASKLAIGGAEHQEKTTEDMTLTKTPQGRVTQINTASVALAAAVATDPPALLSRNMIK
jgi:hypothetical protein